MNTSSREPRRAALHTPIDVWAMWLTTFDPLGWPDPRVYVVLIDEERRPAPVITEITDIDHHLSADDARLVMETFAQLMAHLSLLGSIAVLVCRPGPGPVTDADRACCHALYAAATQAGVRLEVVHVGTDHSIVPVPDEALSGRSA